MKLRLRTANSRQWLWNTIRKLEDSKHKSSSLKEKDRFNQFKTNPSKCKTTLVKTLLTKSRKRNSPFTKHAEWVQNSSPASNFEIISCHVKSTQILCLFDREKQIDKPIFQLKTVKKTKVTLVSNHKTTLQTDNEKIGTKTSKISAIAGSQPLRKTTKNTSK